MTISTVYPGASGGAIFCGRDAAGRQLRFVGNRDRIFRAPVIGEVWSLEGENRRHPQYGDQVHIERASLIQPTGRLVVDFLLKHPAFDGLGIGKAKVARLWAEFGPDLDAVLTKGDVEKLSGVLSMESAQRLAEAWRAVSEEAGVVSFLEHHGFDIRLANKVRRIWPDAPLAKLQENPYRMLAFAAWEQVDRTARSLGVAQDDPRRRVAAVEACLYRRLDAKHTLTPEAMLLQGVCAAVGARNTHIAHAAVVRALSEHAIVATGDGYQPLGAAVMERAVANCLRDLLAGVPGPERNLFSRHLPSITAEAIMSFEERAGLQLNAGQRLAARMALHHPLSVLTGGAGTGKTTVLQVIHCIAEQVGVPVIQMALSGRAAQRMREATGRAASTIAAFLHAAEQGHVDLESEPLVIIDESSMLDLPLMYSIVQVLPARARLLLVGDPYQLPPIGFGLIFQVLAASPNIPRVELIEVHRQARSSGIPQFARDIRHGTVPALPAFAGTCTGVSFIEADDHAILDHIVGVLAAWSGCDDVQVLGVTKRGTSGIRSINATLHAMASAKKPKLEGWGIAEGDPIIYLENDYQKELWNGSLGKIESIVSSNGRCLLLCFLEGARHEIPEQDFHRIDLAYAITVHKAQGSQFKRVIVPVVRSRLLDRTLIYTALTRGMEQVVFIGDRDAFDAAVAAPPRSHERQVGFSI
ncbi:MAG: ATP-dependent RecD-like DNA helicase [Phycisphaerales bacterium]|nr:ATP-dependent RecD-like DNA helicase [Phycisphaerales bacterium]